MGVAWKFRDFAFYVICLFLKFYVIIYSGILQNMAAANWLCVPLKRSSSSEVDFRKPLEKFIKATFPADVFDELKDSISDLNKLRSNAVNRAPEKHQSSLDILLRYILHIFVTCFKCLMNHLASILFLTIIFSLLVPSA